MTGGVQHRSQPLPARAKRLRRAHRAVPAAGRQAGSPAPRAPSVRARAASPLQPRARQSPNSNSKVTVAGGAGKTLKESCTITPRRPIEPTISFGRSKPAAFLTTLPPPVISRPAESTKRTPITKSRTPPWRQAPGPEAPAATTPPSVAPAATNARVERQVLAVRGQRRGDFAHRRAGQRRQRQLSRVVLEHATAARRDQAARHRRGRTRRGPASEPPANGSKRLPGSTDRTAS